MAQLMRGCGLTCLVVCIDDNFCDIRERNCDNKGRDLNYVHPFPRVLRCQRVCDIMGVDITEFRVFWEILRLDLAITHHSTTCCETYYHRLIASKRVNIRKLSSPIFPRRSLPPWVLRILTSLATLNNLSSVSVGCNL